MLEKYDLTFLQADYALKYKTGISAPRLTKKVSEYQKQFQWKAGIPPSPLIGAEQVRSFCFLGPCPYAVRFDEFKISGAP